MNEGRGGASAVVAKGKIYVAGGEWYKQTVEFISLNGKDSRWTVMEARMNVDRSHFGLVWFDGGLFAVGGWVHSISETVGTSELLKDANPEGEWKERVPMERRIHYFGDLVLL